MTQKQLSRMARLLQKKLRLDNWEIRVGFLTEDRLKEFKNVDGRDSAGVTYWNTDNAQAEILVWPETDLKECGMTMKGVLVHELLHILLEGHKDPTGKRDPMYERGLNIIADLLARKT